MGCCGSAQIGGTHLSSCQNSFDGPHEECSCLVLTQKIEQELSRPDGGQRIGNTFASDVGRRAMNCLEETGIAPFWVQIGAGSQPHTAGNRCTQICQDVPKEI